MATMHSPAGSHAQGRVVRFTSSMALCTRFPQEACGVRRPTPRKLKLDSDRMARTTFNGSEASTGAATLGRMVRKRMAPSPAPRAREASTYSVFLALRVPLYTSRATEAHPNPPMTRMMFHTEAPTRFTMASTRMMLGKDWKVSQARMIQYSHLPPLYPASRPRGTPSTIPRPAAAKPTSREVRPP